MGNPPQVRIAPTVASKPAPEQKRFNQLIQRIERARERLRAWHEAAPPFRQAFGEQIVPMLAQRKQTHRNWLLALDAALTQRRFSRADARTLGDMIRDHALSVLGENADDAEMRALFERATGQDYDSQRREDAARTREIVMDTFGVDLGDAALDSDRNLFEEIRARIGEEGAAESTPDEDPWARPQTGRERSRQQAREAARQKRREADRARVLQSVRDIYRKLVSELHPDREPDADLRRTKTAMLQKVNEAYERNDLLTLLEAQLQLEQIDATRLQSIDRSTLKRYNSLLAEQLDSLEAEFDRVAEQFLAELGLFPEARPDPARLGALLAQVRRELRAEIVSYETEMRYLRDAGLTRRWLAGLRAQARARERLDKLVGRFDEDWF